MSDGTDLDEAPKRNLIGWTLKAAFWIWIAWSFYKFWSNLQEAPEWAKSAIGGVIGILAWTGYMVWLQTKAGAEMSKELRRLSQIAGDAARDAAAARRAAFDLEMHLRYGEGKD